MAMTEEARNFRTTGRAVLERMVTLGLTQDEVAWRAHVSTSTIRKLIRGRVAGYHRPKLSALSTTLGWPPDGIARLLAGDDPAALPVRPVPASARHDEPSADADPLGLWAKITRLEPTDVRYVEVLVDRLLADSA